MTPEDRSLVERSRRPRSHPSTTPKHLAKRILDQKRQFPLWGPVPIRARLVRFWPQYEWPAASDHYEEVYSLGPDYERHILDPILPLLQLH